MAPKGGEPVPEKTQTPQEQRGERTARRGIEQLEALTIIVCEMVEITRTTIHNRIDMYTDVIGML